MQTMGPVPSPDFNRNYTDLQITSFVYIESHTYFMKAVKEI